MEDKFIFRLYRFAMIRFMCTLMLIALAVAAFIVWQKPEKALTPSTVRFTVPESQQPAGAESVEERTLWRVVTRRTITRASMQALRTRLKSVAHMPILIHRQEEVTMHAFDDAELYRDQNSARQAAAAWKQDGIESTIIKAQPGLWLVGLGRFYQTHYAEGMQKRLKRIGRPFRYQQRTVPIPTQRFTFKAMPRLEAQALWQQLNRDGIAMPVMMPEDQFHKLYGPDLESNQN